MLIEWTLSTGFAGCEHYGTIEVDDDATEEEIDEMVRDEVFSCIDWGYRKLRSVNRKEG